MLKDINLDKVSNLKEEQKRKSEEDTKGNGKNR